MKTPTFQRRQKGAFTLLEMVIVLAITALVLSAVYTLAQGTLMLADNVQRAQNRDTRQQAFATFCERLLIELPDASTLNLITQEDDGQYLSTLDLEGVKSPFDGSPNCHVTLATSAQAGGGLHLNLTCESASSAQTTNIVLFDDLLQCEWRVFDPTTRQWATNWKESSGQTTSGSNKHPLLMELLMHHAGEAPHHHTFWIAPAEAN